MLLITQKVSHYLPVYRRSASLLSLRQCARTLSMTVPFKLADIGEGITEVELLQWFVKEGDSVKSFDRICEVQSDKATVEITSRYDGSIAKLHYKVGDVMKVGQPIVDISREAGKDQPKLGNETSSAPKLSIPHATRDKVSEHSSKAHTIKGELFATPAVRKLAKENGVDLSSVVATGPKGRVTKEDILLFIGGNAASISPINGAFFQSVSSTSSSSAQESSLPSSVSTTIQSQRSSTIANANGPTHVQFSASQMSGTVPIRGIQKMMFKSMTASKEIPHLTLGDEVVVDNLVRTRDALKEIAAKSDRKLTYLPFFVKALSLALRQFPLLNSSISSDGQNLVIHPNHNIGVAMDSPKGLVVPVLKDVQRKSIMEIAADLAELQVAASGGKLSEPQLSGATFSLSNIGSIAGTYAVPVVVPPQVGIGAIGRFQVLPRYKPGNGNGKSNDQRDLTLTPTTIMNVSWSADHRVIDGATVAKFSSAWASYLTDPVKMLGELR